MPRDSNASGLGTAGAKGDKETSSIAREAPPEVLAEVTADPWAEERRAYLDRLTADAEVELLALQVLELEQRVRQRDAGRRYARILGLPESLADVAAVMILSPSRAARLRAGDLIGRALLRATREAA